MFDLTGRLEPGLQIHLRHVYSQLAMVILVATAGVYIDVLDLFGSVDGLVKTAGLLLAIGLISIIGLTNPDFSNGDSFRFYCLQAAGFCFGLVLGPTVKLALKVDPVLLMSALMYASVIFSCFTLSTVVGYETSYVFMGAPLMALCTALLLSSAMNLLLKSHNLAYYEVVIGVCIDAGFILYDTSRIMEKYRKGERDYVWHALILFIDLFYLFKDILGLLLLKVEQRLRTNAGNGNNSDQGRGTR